MEYSVYVKTNSDGYITAVNSSVFLQETEGWVEIDSGYGDRYHHAQGNYFPEAICIPGGVYRYKQADGKTIKCTAEEISKQMQKTAASARKTVEERMEILERGISEVENKLSVFLERF